MTVKAPTAQTKPGQAYIGAQILCLVLAAYVLVQDIGYLVWNWPFGSSLVGGSLGVGADNEAPDGYRRIAKVERGGALDRAGITAGDLIKMDYAYDRRRFLATGEAVGTTVVRNGRPAHVVIVARPRQPAERGSLVTWLSEFATTIGILFGVIMVARSRRNGTALLLGAGIATFSIIRISPAIYGDNRLSFVVCATIGAAIASAIAPLFYAFSVSFYRETVGDLTPKQKMLFRIYLAIAGIIAILQVSSFLEIVNIPGLFSAFTVILYAGFGLCLVYLEQGWRKSNAARQQRYAIILLATGSIVLAQTINSTFTWLYLTFDLPREIAEWGYLIGNSFVVVFAYPLLTYAIFRQKVFDLGFAVNRTLVYTGVSASLLAMFGLIEWAVDHYVPVEGREKNAVIDAAIALGTFLLFHRVRDLVEHAIEGLFFRRWQQAEAALRRFVHEAAFVRHPESLTKTFACALSQFADGAAAAIYVIGDDGRAHRAETTALGFGPTTLEVDDPLLVTLRAGPRPFSVDTEQSERLVAPMVNRNDLTGLIMLGTKTTGAAYRPDEMELIGWATRQVGLDLRALEIERLSTQASELRRENATLRSLIPAQA